MDAAAVPPLALRPVESLVDILQDGIDSLITVFQGGDVAGNRHPHRLPAADVEGIGRDSTAKLLSDVHGILHRQTGEYDAELLSAEAAEDIRKPDVGGDRPGYPDQGLVSASRPQGVVDSFKMVDIDHDDRQIDPLAPGEMILLLELLEETASIGDSREGMHRGLLRQLVFHAGYLPIEESHCHGYADEAVDDGCETENAVGGLVRQISPSGRRNEFGRDEQEEEAETQEEYHAQGPLVEQQDENGRQDEVEEMESRVTSEEYGGVHEDMHLANADDPDNSGDGFLLDGEKQRAPVQNEDDGLADGRRMIFQKQKIEVREHNGGEQGDENEEIQLADLLGLMDVGILSTDIQDFPTIFTDPPSFVPQCPGPCTSKEYRHFLFIFPLVERLE